jgi:two-component system phosphate regulon response regulator PhoB
MPQPTVLIVEDDRALADVLAYNLKQAGYDTLLSRDGQDGLTQAELRLPDLVVLDLMLPVVDGLEVCRRLRANPATRGMLILMLTAKSEETDQVVGFSVGADDYVTKPFSVKVLLERVRALIRRTQAESDERDIAVCRSVRIDRRRHEATIDGEPLELTLSEFRLLEALVRQPGRAFSRTELIDSALGDDALVQDRTIDVHIRSLRKKMGPHAELIETVRGIGYRFREAQ